MVSKRQFLLQHAANSTCKWNHRLCTRSLWILISFFIIYLKAKLKRTSSCMLTSTQILFYFNRTEYHFIFLTHRKKWCHKSVCCPNVSVSLTKETEPTIQRRRTSIPTQIKTNFVATTRKMGQTIFRAFHHFLSWDVLVCTFSNFIF